MKAMLEEPYTLFAAFIGSTLITMATHGTDQDSVQRMLTAPNYRKSQLSLILSGVMDFPIAMAFLTVGILLSVYYSVVSGVTLPAADNEIFGHYIVHEMPVVFRGLIIAGVFATMMGSTSAALNALATSFTKDFYLPYIRRDATDRQAIRAARIATAVFGVLMIIVATVAANAVLHDAKLTIIPIAIGILGYTYGALLAVFLLGMLTRSRGSDGMNVVAMIVGIISVLVLCKITIPAFDIPALFRGNLVAGEWNFSWFMPEWWPKIAWPWFVFVGCVVTLAISVLFRTPASQIAAAKAHVRNASPLKEIDGAARSDLPS
jgi:Na+/proline symporter